MSGAAREGTCHAAEDFLVRPGAFDAVGDRIPVPGRAHCPRPEVSAPDRAQRLPSRGMSPTAHHLPGGANHLGLMPSAVAERQVPIPEECLTPASTQAHHIDYRYIDSRYGVSS